MKLRLRRSHGVAPLLFAMTLPLTGIGLLTLSDAKAIAQAVPTVPGFPETPPSPDDQGGSTPSAPTQPNPTPAPKPSPKPSTKRKGKRGKSTTAPAPDTATPPTPVIPPVQPTIQAPAPIPAGTPRIGEIIVTGNKIFTSAAIIALSGHQVGDPCTDQVLSEMKGNLTQTGSFGTQRDEDNPDDWVKVRSEMDSADSKTCTIHIEVEENDPVKDFTITGSGPIKTDEIQALLHARRNSVYNSFQFQRDTKDILQLYNSRGYVAVLGADAGLNSQGVLVVPIMVVRVAEIKITGNKKTHKYVILREMKTKVGDYFNREVFTKDRSRLYNLDLFEEPPTPQEELIAPGQVRLTLSVVEKRTGSISVGAGYSSTEQLIGRAEITETNFRGRGETVNLLGETGGVANRSSVELGFTEPYLDKRHTALTVQLYDKTIYRFGNSLTNASAVSSPNIGTNSQYYEQRIGTTITVSRPIRDTYRVALTGRVETVHTDSLDLGSINAAIVQDGPVESIGGTLIHDTRDLIIDPASGGLQTLNLQVGHANLSPPSLIAASSIVGGTYGSVNFSKLSFEARQFYSKGGPRRRDKPDQDKTTLALRGLVGASAGTLPFFEQFFVGGADSLRGYRETRFWGSYLMLGSAEVRQPLARGLKGVLFIDVGDAWGGPYSNTNIAGFQQGGFQPHVGVGFGIRVRTPLGPIRLDFGFGDEGGRTHFSIGNVF